jgi:hypothetical protein
MYIPGKPAKYGLKIMSLTDFENSYLFKAYLYAGKDTDGIDFSKRETKSYQNRPSQLFVYLSQSWGPTGIYHGG